MHPAKQCLATGVVSCHLPSAQNFSTSLQTVRVQSWSTQADERRGVVFAARQLYLSTLFSITTCWLSHVVTKHLPYKHKTSCHSISTHEEAKQYWNRAPELHAGFQYHSGKEVFLPRQIKFCTCCLKTLVHFVRGISNHFLEWRDRGIKKLNHAF